MTVFMTLVQIAAIFGLPALIMSLRSSKPVKLIGTIGVAYATGILLAVITFLFRKSGIDLSFNTDVGEIGGHLAIGIAIPFILFSFDIRQVRNLSKRAFLSFSLIVLSVIIVSISAFFIFRGKIENNGAISGMAAGLYTGGTPNLNAIGSILGVDPDIIATCNISDMLIGAVFYLFLLTACKPLLKRFLNAPPPENYYKSQGEVANVDSLDLKDAQIKPLIRNFLLALAMAVAGAGIGVIVWLIVKSGSMTDYVLPAMMLTVTVLGILASFNKKIREVKGNAALGHYLILVFSLAISMSVRLENIGLASLYIFLQFTFVTIVSFLLHAVFCKIFRIDVDCAIVTMAAGIYGPAFIPAVTAQLKNDKLAAAGLICGSLGYAIGTFLGAGIGYLLLML